MWSDDSTVGPEYRTGVAGFAYVGTVCSSFRYSIVEDDGFQSSLVIFIKFVINLHLITFVIANCS